MDALPQSILDIINAAVTQAVQKAAADTAAAIRSVDPPAQKAPERDYFKITEKLLYSYPALKRILSDKEAYTKIELRERSKDIKGLNYNASLKSKDDIIDEMERDKEAEYDKTMKDFLKVDRVLQQFKERKEFAVIRIYYFKENADGTQRAPDEEMTWEEVSYQLEREVKTLRRWRNEIINEIALCIFGIDAAIQAGTYRNT